MFLVRASGISIIWVVIEAACIATAGVGVAGCRRQPSAPRVTIAVWGGAEEVDQFRSRVLTSVRRQTPNVSIEVIYIPRDYHVKLATLMAAGQPPDLFYLSDEYVPQYAELGALLDLTQWIEGDDDPAVDLSDYYPSIVSNYRWGGGLYGLPWIAQPVVLFCNEELFAEVGVELPDRQWRWVDFVEAGKRLTADLDGDGLPDRWGFVTNGWPPFEMFVWQNGGDTVSADGKHVRLLDAKCVEAAQFYADLIGKYRVAPPLDVVTEQGFSELFRAGKVAMFMGGAADELDSVPGLNVSVHEVPTGPDGARATFAWNAGLCISRGTADKELAYRTWKLFLDAIQHWKIPAPRRSLAAKLETIEPRKARAAEVIRNSMTYMRPFRVIARQRQWDTIMTEEFEEPLLRGAADARTLARRASPELQMLLR